MSEGKCQLCGRRKALNRKGLIVRHWFFGEICAGAYHPPIEHDDGRLAELVAAAEARQLDAWAKLRELRDRRANYIPPELERAAWATTAEIKRRRRLERHRKWPARYRRQMERYGYAEAPPAYLLEREAAAAG